MRKKDRTIPPPLSRHAMIAKANHCYKWGKWDHADTIMRKIHPLDMIAAQRDWFVVEMMEAARRGGFTPAEQITLTEYLMSKTPRDLLI